MFALVRSDISTKFQLDLVKTWQTLSPRLCITFETITTHGAVFVLNFMQGRATKH